MTSSTLTFAPTAIGPLTLTSDGIAITGVSFDGDAAAAWRNGDAADVLHEAAAQLRQYFAGERTSFDLPLAPGGTEFQRRVWEVLRAIPYGETISYGELAARIGNRNASRAVGLANNRNPLPVIVPCHRVVGADGSLTGYGGGLDRKRDLLDLEARVAVEHAFGGPA